MKRHSAYLFNSYFFAPFDPATSRAHSMKRSTTGLRARFFNVRIATAKI